MLDGCFGDRVYFGRVRHVVLNPFHKVEVGGRIHGNDIAVEKIRNYGEVAISCKLIGDPRMRQTLFERKAGYEKSILQLDIEEINSKNVSEDDYGVLRALVLRVGEVRSHCLY